MTDDKVQINILVQPDRKKKWQEYAADEHGSLTHLIRHSVEREIAGANDPAQSGGIPDNLSETLTELETGNEGIQRELRGVKRELRDVKAAVEKPDQSIREVANKVLDVLPQEQDEAEYMATHEPSPTGKYDEERVPATVDQLTEELGEPEDVIVEALDMLESETHMIRSDEGHYWRDT